MRKSRASKDEVKEIRAEVDKLKADQLPLDLFFDESAPPPAAVVLEPQQEEEPRHPRKKRKLPSTEGVVIEVAQVQEDTFSTPPDVQPVQDPAPVPAAEQQQAGDQSEVPTSTKD